MTSEASQRVAGLHSLAIVGNTNQAAPTLFNIDLDFSGARIQGVLDQLLHDRSRPLDDFTRSNLVSNIIREDFDFRHKIRDTKNSAAEPQPIGHQENGPVPLKAQPAGGAHASPVGRSDQ
jgi:hypothetical protein